MTPGQFSAAVAFIVLLVGSGFLAGYIWGIKSMRDEPDSVRIAESVTEAGGEDIQTGLEHPTKPDRAPTMTFYSELTEDRVENPPVRNPQKKREVVSKPSRNGVPTDSEAKITDRPSTRTVIGEGTMIQVGSYREEEKAEGFLKGLSDSGYQGAVIRVDLGPRGVWFRVRLGPYPSESHAQKALAKLQDEASIKGFIVR